MMGSSTSQFQFRAAIALNNMAITMLERSCHHQAFLTLKDAVKVLMEASQQTTQLEQVHEMIKQANRRASKPEKASHFAPIMVVSHDVTFISLDFALRQDRSAVTNTFIRIDTDDTDSLESHNQDPCLVVAILVYNFGVATLRAKKKDQDEDTVLKFDKGINILKPALNLLARAYEEGDDPFTMLSTLVISTIILKTLAHALEARGRDEEAKSCTSTLDHIRGYARKYDETAELVSRCRKVAAAA
jgi:hypothetical protein